MEQRLARLEDWRSNIEGLMPELKTAVEKANEGIHRVEVRMAEMSAAPKCPQPGLCLALQGMAETTQKRVGLIENEQALAKGGLRLAHLFLGLMVSSGFSAVIAYLFWHFSKHTQ